MPFAIFKFVVSFAFAIVLLFVLRFFGCLLSFLCRFFCSLLSLFSSFLSFFSGFFCRLFGGFFCRLFGGFLCFLSGLLGSVFSSIFRRFLRGVLGLFSGIFRCFLGSLFRRFFGSFFCCLFCRFLSVLIGILCTKRSHHHGSQQHSREDRVKCFHHFCTLRPNTPLAFDGLDFREHRCKTTSNTWQRTRVRQLWDGQQKQGLSHSAP
ncbi:hypothetical protein ASS64_16220 [Erythrobacter sp. AP23]|nr:hypothetical protein ASS64_16220 [Erythrobacter sp. AP23]